MDSLNTKECINNKKQIASNGRTRRRPSDGEEGRCFRMASLIKMRYASIMKSKFPEYLCMFIYVVICLLGNIVTGVIFLDHHLTSIGMRKSDNISTNYLFNLELNESTILDSSFDFDMEFMEAEQFDLYQIFVNESASEVSQF